MVTQAHVYAPGPSLTNAPVAAEAGLRFCVNFAARIVKEYDYLVFGDQMMLGCLQSMHKPECGIVCPMELLLPARDALACPIYVTWAALDMPEDLGYSANIALWAAGCWATHVHAWGFDHHGNMYADGSPLDSAPAEIRWPRERRFFDRTVELLTQKGVAVIQH